jgi:ABC-type polysaccharide/polyol phosphate transport system ATPase subunit
MKKNRRCYTTGSKKSTLFKSIEKVIYPDMFKVDLSKFLAHMIHVTADVLLQATGKPCHFIQTHLGWEGQISTMKYARHFTVF